MGSYLDGMLRYFEFWGRSSRAQYFLFFLFQLLLVCAGMAIDYKMHGGFGRSLTQMPYTLFMVLIHIVPAVTVQVRRLHDIGKSGAWFLLSFVPLGSLVLLYWAFQPSDGQQDYAENNAGRPRQRARSTIPAGVRMGNSGRLSNGGPDLNEGRFI
tara:strand:- start:3246 stop:3710 length:465 start_codon:yes stop_codon:yes gene_type:complete